MTKVSLSQFLLPLFVVLLFACQSTTNAQFATSKTITLFDGKTLNGWIEVNNTDATFNRTSFADLKGFAQKMLEPSDPVSAFVSALMSETVKKDLASVNHDDAAAVRNMQNSLSQELNRIISETTLYDAERFSGVKLRDATVARNIQYRLLQEVNRTLDETARSDAERSLLETRTTKYDLARLNKLLIEDAFEELKNHPLHGWIVKDGVIASTGAERGVLYTAQDFERFRITFDIRHIPSGKSNDHQAGVLIFCTRPKSGEKPLDSLGGIQFQVPKGHHWDYRPGKNNSGKDFFKRTGNDFNEREWSRVEIWADATKGIAKMAVTQPIGSKAVLTLEFNDPTAGKVGPFALQMHNADLFDEYRNITIEVNPEVDGLISLP